MVGRMFCPPKPSGSMPAGQARPRPIRGEIQSVQAMPIGTMGTTPNQTENVGQYSANPWGFFDMHGNVWEWTADAYGSYASGAQTDPFNAGATGSYLVIRGGSWNESGTNLRSAYRYSINPSDRRFIMGFRVGFQYVPNNPPTDLNSTAALEFDENLPTGTPIANFTATDGDNHNLVFSLVTNPSPDLASLGNLKAWLDASDSKFLSTNTSSLSPPSDDQNISQWYDLSGNGHHAKVKAVLQSGIPPVYSKPGVILNSAGLVLDNSKIAFDAWSKIHVFIAFYQPGDANFATLFGKSNHTGWMGNDKDMGWSVFTHRLDGSQNLWGIGAINSAASGNIYLNNFNRALQGADGGGPGMFTIKYAADGGFWVESTVDHWKEPVVRWLEGTIQTSPRFHDWS